MSAPLPPYSQLDPGQVIKQAYDEQNRRIRVSTEISTVTIGSGEQEILITDDIDAIKIGDGNHQYLAINPDGSINVNVVIASSGTVVSEFNSISSVPSGINTTLLTYTVPIGMIAYLKRLEVSGTNIASYEFYIDSVLSGRKRTYFGSSLNADFDFSSNTTGLKLLASSVFQVKVTHDRPTLGDFDSRLQLTLTT